MLLIAMRVLMEGGWRTQTRSGESGAVPLGFPLLVGPGAITTTIVTIQSFGYDVTLVAIIMVFCITVACLVLSEGIYRLLGQVGSNVFARVMAVFIAAIAVHITWGNGISCTDFASERLKIRNAMAVEDWHHPIEHDLRILKRANE